MHRIDWLYNRGEIEVHLTEIENLRAMSYRDLKSDGWKWHRNRLLDPQRAERLGLVLAVATLWMVMLGSRLENQSPSAALELPITDRR